jgi:signal transduction histidine kinase
MLYENLCANIETLQQEKEMVNRLEQAKTDFMRSASHELKTPITALNGIVEGMIDNVGIYKNKEKYLAESKVLIDRLTELVNDILRATAMETLIDNPGNTDVAISGLLERALEAHRILIEQKGLDIRCSVMPFSFETNETILYHTILNLISNAVKYTPQAGVIDIRLCIEASADLTVENQVSSLEDIDLDRLFEPFYTLSFSRDKNNSGSGLGLYIVKRNLDQLGLEYKLERSEIGLRFTICFRH